MKEDKPIKLSIDDVVRFIEYYDKLTPSEKCSVHPPPGGCYGIYNLPKKEILNKWIKYFK